MRILFLLFAFQLLCSCNKSITPAQENGEDFIHANQIKEGVEMNVDENAVLELLNLIKKKKFGPEQLYVGLLPKKNQGKADRLLNESIKIIISILEDKPTKDAILVEYKNGLNSLDEVAADTEDREKVCEYYD